MANSKITVNFTGEIFEEDFISFKVFNNLTNSVNLVATETWKVSRRASYEIPTVKVSDTDNVAQRFMLYFDIDYNGSNLFTISYINASTVEIIANNNKYIFQEFLSLGNINATIINTTDTVTPFEVVGFDVLQHAFPCNNITFRIQTNVPIISYFLYGVNHAVNTSSLDIVWVRGVDFKIALTNADGKVINYPTQNNADLLTFGPFNLTTYVPKLISSNILIDTNTLINGTTITLNIDLNINTQGLIEHLNLEYSLDNVNWSNDNVFTGQTTGNYTAYIRDQFGCIVSKEFEVSGQSKSKAYFFISKANAFNFIKSEVIDNETIFSNSTNNFKQYEYDGIHYNLAQLFNKTDDPCIQIKSNNQVNKLYIRDENNNLTELDLEKKTDNIDKFFSLDCIIYKHDNGNLAAYFNAGNVYDEFGNVISDYVLNGNLPDFARKGNLVTIDSIGTLEISSVTIDSNKNKKIIIFNNSYEGEEVVSIASSIYNLLSYDIYEHYFNFIQLTDGFYDLILETTPLNEGTVFYISETFEISDYHFNTLHIQYYNKESNNRSIFYKFGIKHILRVEFSETEGYFSEENDININDDSVKSIKSFLNLGSRILFEDLTKNQMETLAIALSSENVFINGIGYVKDSELDIVNLQNTNLYSISVKMLISGETFSSEESGYTGQDEIFEDTIFPNIITDGTNFIKS